jgi:hypothetical protein
MSEKDNPPTTMAEWTVTDARVVGTLKRGGAIVESCPSLNIREGRTWRGYGEGHEYEYLGYEFTFEASDEPPQCAMSQSAAIVISGKDSEGNSLLIEGRGWLGFDERGRPQGNFNKPPRIRILLGDDPATALKNDVAKQWAGSPLNPAAGETVQ